MTRERAREEEREQEREQAREEERGLKKKEKGGNGEEGRRWR